MFTRIRYCLLLIVASAAFLNANAQFEKTFARLRLEDVNMKECPFDPGASAVILINEGISSYDAFGDVFSVHRRVKILKSDALSLAEFIIPYRSKGNNVFIKDLVAMSININEDGTTKESPIDKKTIFDRKATRTHKQISVAFPEVRVGTILEYQYSIHYPYRAAPNDWEFQLEYPVCFSSFTIKSYSNWHMTYSLQKWPGTDVIINDNKKDNLLYFEMKNIKSFTDEPYMDSRETYIQKVGFHGLQYFNLENWKEMSASALESDYLGKQLKIKLPEAEAEISLATANKSEIEKLSIIYSRVQKNIKWNEYDAILSTNGIKEVWKNKKGNSASINLLMIRLMRSAGLDSYPMFVSERENGKINTTRAYPDQFSTLYCVVQVGNKKYYLDATKKNSPWYLTPYSSLNSTAFILDKEKGGLQVIEEDSLKFSENIAIDESFSTDGILTGNVQIISKDYARPSRLDLYKDDTAEYVENVIKNGTKNLEIKNFKLLNEDADSLPLKQTFSYTTKAQVSDDYSFLGLDILSNFHVNPFLADKRFSAINFGYKKLININLVITVPETFKIDVIPKSLTMVNTDKTISFTRNIKYNEDAHQIVARMKIEFNKTVYAADEYDEVKEFYKKMINLFNEQIVLKKS